MNLSQLSVLNVGLVRLRKFSSKICVCANKFGNSDLYEHYRSFAFPLKFFLVDMMFQVLSALLLHLLDLSWDALLPQRNCLLSILN